MKKIYLILVLSCLTYLSGNVFAQTSTFNYTGSVQTYTVPPGCTSVSVDAMGGCGGAPYQSGGGAPVIKGGRVQCNLSVSGGQVLYIYVGGAGGSYSVSTAGGWNGGANSGGTYCAAGGGASDIRLSNVTVGTYTPTNRVVVAGGGGGGGDFLTVGGLGGGLTGGSGGIYSSYQAFGGSQTAGGTNTVGSSTYYGNIGTGGTAAGSSGGGGGGLYGGAGGYFDGGGGGGSSYTDPTLCTAVTHTQGYSGATGNGVVKITTGCPGVIPVPGSLAFGTVGTGTTSAPMGLALTGFNLTSGLTITAPTNFQISLDGVTYSSSITYSSFTGGAFASTIFYVTFTPPAATSYSGNIVVSGGGLFAPVNIPVTGTGAAPCSGTPTAGSSTINGGSTASGNASTAFTLNVPGATVGGGITYQWQSGPSSSGPWSSIAGANTASYVYSGLTGNTWFQCLVSCSGGGTATSGTCSATFTLPSACIPSCYYGTTSYYVGNSSNPVIINGASGSSISDASNAGSGTGGSSWYYNNISQNVTFNQGGSYTASLGPGYYYVPCQVWIDFNDNGTFDASESVGGMGLACCTNISRTNDVTINIPAGASYGAHRMRAIAEENCCSYAPGASVNYPMYPSLNPCPIASSASVYYADARDYTAIIARPVPTINATPVSSFGYVTVGTSSAPVKYTVVNGTNLFPAVGFANVTVGAPFLASLNGTTWSTSVNIPYSGGAISNQNVYIQFNPTASTSYSGTLTVNGGGSTPATVSLSGNGSAACTGTPTPGTASVSTPVGNSLSPITLTLTGTSSVGGITYQWQSSPTGTGSWTNIAGAYTPVYNFVGISATTYFQCVVTCPTGSNATSNVVSVSLVPSIAASSCTIPSTPYFGICTGCGFFIASPSYPFICPGDASTQINDATTIPTAYGDLTATMGCTMHAGGTYTATIGGGNYYNGVGVQFWIDFSGNGTFETSESVGGVNWGGTAPAQNPVITVPSGVSNGVYRMRAVIDYTGYGGTAGPSYPSIPPCPTSSAPYYFEARDYKITIGTPPPANVSPCAGKPGAGIVSPSIAASCSPFTTTLFGVGETILASGITYQWQSSSSATGPFTNIAGATGQSYIPPAVSTIGTTYYRDTITCANGPFGATTPVQAVTLNQQPTAITGNPNVCSGLTTTLASTPSGGAWTSSNTSQATVGSSTGVVTGVTAGTVPTISYTLPTGCFVTQPVTVNLNPSPITGTSPICGSLNATYTDGTSGGNWSSSNPAIASVGSTSGVVTGGTAGSTTISYTSASGCSVTYPVTINALSAISGSGSTCLGTNTTLTDATSGGTWSSSNSAVASVNSSGTVYGISLGSATISYTIASTGCTAIKPFAVTNPPSLYTVTGGGVYCSGGAGVAVNLNGSDPGISYTLFDGATNLGSLSGSGIPISFGLQTLAGTYGVVANFGTACAVTMTGTVTVNINPLPTAYIVSGGGNYCIGGTGVHVYLNNSTIGTNYQLYVTTLGGTIPSGTTVAGTGAPLDFGLQTTLGTYTVVGTNTSTGCVGNMSGSVVVGNNPLPTAQAVTPTAGGYCVGGTGVAIGLAGSVVGTNYQLMLAGVPVGSPVAGTGAAITFGLQTIGGTYQVVATIASTGCSATMSGSSVLTVNPLPTVYTVTGGGAYCSGGTGVNIGLNGSQINTNYQLYKDGVLVPGQLVSGTGASFVFPNLVTLAGSYTVVATNTTTGCVNNMFGSVAVSINPLPTTSFTVTGGGGYCAGTTGVHVYLSGSATGTTYQLFCNGGLVGAATGTGSSIDFGLQLTVGTYTVVGTITATGCTATMSGSVSVFINALPLAQTVTGGGNYCSGATTGFPTIGLSGSQSGVNYQLYLGTTAVGTPVAGSGSPLTFTFTSAPTGGSYTVVAINASTGCTLNMTGAALISVNPLPTIYSVTGGGNYCAGGTGVHIGLSASNIGISYTLMRAGTAITSLSGGGAALDFGLQTVSSPAYTIMATNTTTLCTVNMAGTVTVGTSPLPVATYSVTAPSGTSYCSGGSGVPVGLSSSDAGINYQLVRGGTSTGTPVAGTGSSITFGSQTAGLYTVIAMNGTTGCTANETGSQNITASPLPNVYTVGGGGNYCAGGSGFTITLSASQTGVDYTLYNGASLVAGSLIAGSGSAITFPAQTAAGTYTVMATNHITGCQSLMSGSAMIGILPLPISSYVITGGGSYCNGGTGVPVGLSSSSLGVTYQLYNGATAVGAPMLGSGVALNFGSQTAAGPYTVIGTNATTGCSSTMTGTATVTISPLPAAQTLTGGGNYCPGTTGVAVGLAGSVSGTNYQLYVGSTATGSPVAGTGAPVSFGLQTTPGVYTVAATTTATGCTGNMPGSVTVGTYTLPVIYNVTGGGNLCPGGAGVNVGLSGSALGVNYQLYNGSGPVGASVAGTGYALNFGLQTAAGTYTVVASNGTTSCTNNMAGSATVIVNPLPAAHAITGGGNYCLGTGGSDVGLDGSNVGTHYQLYVGSFPAGSSLAGTGFPLDFGMQTAPGTYTVIATSSATTCSSTMTGSTTINTIALPAVFTLSSGGNTCSGGAGVDITLSGSETGVNYQLYRGGSVSGLAVAGTGSALDFGPQTAGGTYTVIATSVTTGCVNTMSGSAIVNVNPLPTAYTVVGGGSYCNGGTGVHVMLSGSNVGVSYQLEVGGVYTGLPMAGTGSGLDFGPQTAAGNYRVLATNTATGCINTMSGSVVITINPLPTAYTLVGAGSNYCAGGTGIEITLSSTDAGMNYQLYRSGAPVGAPVAGTGYEISFGYQTGAGSYTAVAINPATGCTKTMSGTPNIIINPLPTAFTVTGGGNFCNGGAGVHVGLSGSNVGVSYQLWNGTAVGGPVAGTGYALDFGTQTTGGVYTVVATSTATSCVNTMAGSATVVVNPLPSVNTVTGGGNYCDGGAGVHVGLSGSTSGVNYQLYNGVSPVGTTVAGSGLAVDFGYQASAGTYSVMAINATTGCTNAMAGSVNVGINPLPHAYAVTGGGNYCPGGPGVHVGTGGSETGVSYQLYNGTAPVGTAWAGTGSAIDFGYQTAAGSYKVVATNTTTGCAANMSGAVTVGLNSTPVVYTVIGGGNYCSGGTGVHVGLNSSTTGINYQLYLGGSPVGAMVTGTGGPIDFGAQTGAGAYTVIATNSSTGCTATMSGSASIVINALVTPSVTLSTGSGDTVCGGHLVTMTALAGNGGSTPAYQWSVNGTPQSGSGNTFSFLPTNGDVVTVTMTSSAMCATPPTVGSSMALTVMDNGMPAVTLTASPGDTVCRGTTVNYTISSVFGGSPTYTWIVNGANMGGGTSYTRTPANGDEVYVIMNSTYRCRLANNVQSNHMVMNVADPVLPTVSITANPGTHIGRNQSVTLMATVQNGGSTPSYQWLLNGTDIPGANLQSYTSNSFNDGDSVTCQVISSGTCSGQQGFNSVTIHVSNVGVKNVGTLSGQVQVVPNPSNGQFTVKGTLSTTSDEEVSLEVTNMLGQVVYSGKVMARGGVINETIRLSSSTISNGMYLLNLRSESDNEVFHIVVEQ